MKIETKYNVGDSVCLMDDNRISFGIVERIFFTPTDKNNTTVITYQVSHSNGRYFYYRKSNSMAIGSEFNIQRIYENELFKTKEELINSL